MESCEELVGRTIARKFLIESPIGEGAMGAVYRARQVDLGTIVAVKVMHRALSGVPTFAARFLREAQAASLIDHPSSIRVIDFGEEPDGLLYIAMEFLDGCSLAQILAKEGPLPVARIVSIASQVLAALAVAHDLGVVHRDLKPDNIMVRPGTDDEGKPVDVAKVCDFGVAKLLQERAGAPSVTAEGLVIGTPEYMSPEQARGEALDARSDVYSMGVILFQLMTGKVPFDAETAFGTALMHVTDEPTKPRLLNPGVDARLEAICLRAMRKRPEDRHASVRELRAELRELAGRAAATPGKDAGKGSSSGSLLQALDLPRRSSALPILGAGLAAALALGFVLVRQQQQQSARPESVQTTTVASAHVQARASALPVADAPPAIAAAPAAPALAAPPAVADAPAVAAPPAVAGKPVAAAAAPRTRHASTKKGHGARSSAAALEAELDLDAPSAIPEAPRASPNAKKAPTTDKPSPARDEPLPDFPIPPSPPAAPPPAAPPPAAPPPPAAAPPPLPPPTE